MHLQGHRAIGAPGRETLTHAYQFVGSGQYNVLQTTKSEKLSEYTIVYQSREFKLPPKVHAYFRASKEIVWSYNRTSLYNDKVQTNGWNFYFEFNSEEEMIEFKLRYM